MCPQQRANITSHFSDLECHIDRAARAGAFMRSPKTNFDLKPVRFSLQPIAKRNQNRADVPREERKWYGC